MNTNTQNQSPLLRIQGSSIHTHKRSALWYIAASIIALLIIGFSFYGHSWSFIAVFTIAVILYLYILHKPNPEVLLEIHENNIRYNTKTFSFNECTEFWIINHHYDCELHIRVQHSFTDDLRIFIGKENTDAVRKALKKHINENGQKHERLFDYLTRLLKL